MLLVVFDFQRLYQGFTVIISLRMRNATRGFFSPLVDPAKSFQLFCCCRSPLCLFYSAQMVERIGHALVKICFLRLKLYRFHVQPKRFLVKFAVCKCLSFPIISNGKIGIDFTGMLICLNSLIVTLQASERFSLIDRGYGMIWVKLDRLFTDS